MSAHGWYIYGSRHEAGAPDTVLLAHDGPTRPEHHDQLRALLAAGVAYEYGFENMDRGGEGPMMVGWPVDDIREQMALRRATFPEVHYALRRRPVGPWETVEEPAPSALVPGRQDTPAETRTCTGCDGTGQRRDFNTDGEFESVERCGGCGGTGRVAIEDAAESGAAR